MLIKYLMALGVVISVVLCFVLCGWRAGLPFAIFVVCNHWLDYLVNTDIVNEILKLRR